MTGGSVDVEIGGVFPGTTTGGATVLNAEAGADVDIDVTVVLGGTNVEIPPDVTLFVIVEFIEFDSSHGNSGGSVVRLKRDLEQ